jgi:hypothetical protein
MGSSAILTLGSQFESRLEHVYVSTYFYVVLFYAPRGLEMCVSPSGGGGGGLSVVEIIRSFRIFNRKRHDGLITENWRGFFYFLGLVSLVAGRQQYSFWLRAGSLEFDSRQRHTICSPPHFRLS